MNRKYGESTGHWISSEPRIKLNRWVVVEIHTKMSSSPNIWSPYPNSLSSQLNQMILELKGGLLRGRRRGKWLLDDLTVVIEWGELDLGESNWGCKWAWGFLCEFKLWPSFQVKLWLHYCHLASPMLIREIRFEFCQYLNLNLPRGSGSHILSNLNPEPRVQIQVRTRFGRFVNQTMASLVVAGLACPV